MPRTWSLITVTYNSEATLREYWSADRPEHVEWITVDNGSQDNSPAVAGELGARVIDAGANLGFSAANNRGLASATGDYVAFVNPDVRVDYDDLDALADAIDELGGLVTPQLLNDDGSLQPNGRGAPLLAHKVLNRLRGSEAGNGYQLFADRNERRRAFWIIGALVAAHAETFRALGGWSERFFLYYEDKDLSVRAWDAGYPVTVVGSIRWVHGWARDTSRFRLKPWVREIDSLARFYSLYPEFLLGGAAVRRRHPQASEASGKLLTRG